MGMVVDTNLTKISLIKCNTKTQYKLYRKDTF